MLQSTCLESKYHTDKTNWVRFKSVFKIVQIRHFTHFYLVHFISEGFVRPSPGAFPHAGVSIIFTMICTDFNFDENCMQMWFVCRTCGTLRTVLLKLEFMSSSEQYDWGVQVWYYIPFIPYHKEYPLSVKLRRNLWQWADRLRISTSGLLQARLFCALFVASNSSTFPRVI